jgi:hypothetical protein
MKAKVLDVDYWLTEMLHSWAQVHGDPVHNRDA